MKSIGLIQLSSYGACLEAVQSLSQFQSIECLEVLPFGTYSQILLVGDFAELNQFRKFLRTADLQKSTFVPYDERILKTFYHKETASLGKHLLIIESSFVGSIFEILSEAFRESLRVVDFYHPRFAGAFSTLILTGDQEEPLKQVLSNAQKASCKAVFIENPSSHLTKFF